MSRKLLFRALKARLAAKACKNLCMAALFSVVSTGAWALSEVGGVYQIGTADDLVAFAELVNGANPYANAVLTADIVKPVSDVSMIGRSGQDYQGIFDGAGHTITIDLYSQEAEGTALFRNIGVHGVVKDLKVQGTITTNQKLAAGIAAWNSGIISGCYIDVNVVSAFAGDATHGGIAAVGYRGTVIENCLAKFTINGRTTQNCGGIVGWASDKINIANCLVISDGSNFDLSNNGSNNIARNDGNINIVDLQKYNENPYGNRPSGANYNNYATNQWGTNKATTVVAYDDLADGRICYQLNNDQSRIAWVQTIGTDPFPVPAAFGQGQVYASRMTDCDGKSLDAATYSNSGSVNATPHTFDKYGVCTTCGCFNFHGVELDPTDNSLVLKSANDIFLCEGWNRIGDGFKLNMKMANDIEVISEPGELIFNDVNWVDGNFNGQGNQLTIEMADIEVNNASFIPKFTGIFENVIMHGTISTSGQFAGSVTSHTYSDKVIIRNVFSDIDFNLSHAGDNTSAGIIGVSESKTRVENVIFAGNINGNPESTECLAGFCGWASGQTYFTNCAFIGTLNGAIGDSKNVSRNPGNVTSDNVYFLEDYGFDDTDKFIVFEGGPEGVENGELAYYLNGKQGGVERFYQKIGQDIFPMPIKKDGALVYAVASSYRCDGAPQGSVAYSNSPSSATLPPHQYDEGFCTVCDALQEDYLTPVNGWFEISDGAQLVWWTNYAAKHLDVSARLTADIDMDGYCDRWANVGTEGDPFYGNFDGQFHTISNLVIEHPNDNGVGLIAVMNSLPSKGFGGISDEDARAAEGVYIKNVVLDESCYLLGRGYVALVGMTAPWAGHVNIKGVMMCGDVSANGGPNAAGVFGCVMSSACHVTIDNCGMVGNVYGPKENGSFSGWLGDWAEVTNCFAVGEVEGTESDARYFARYGNARVNDNIKNCYALHGTQEHVGIVTPEDFESGALAWKANGEQFRTGYWFQNLEEDAYPYPDPSHGSVIFAAEQYFSITDEASIDEVAAEIQDYEEGQLVDVVAATQSLIDEWQDAIDALPDAATILEFADAIDALNAARKAVWDNAAIYDAYIAKCEEIKKELEGNDSFNGSLRAALEYYLYELDEPYDDNKLGTYEYIVETHTATGEEIQAETQRVIDWLAAAIAEDYNPGTDVSNLIPNSDFSKNHKDNWTNAWSTGQGNTKDDAGKTYYGVEAWNVTGDQYQTVEDMKPGYYLVGINAAFRPSNDRYSTNYAAGIYANGIFNYFPTVVEDYVSVNDTIDQVNCNLHGAGATDLAIYDDNYSTDDTNGAAIVGYATHGETGMAIASKVGRYQVYTIAKVGDDGKLTIGIKNPGTKYGNDWTGWGALKVVYCGDEEAAVSDALDQVLENMNARAESIIAYISADEPAAGPNFPETMRVELDDLVGQVSDVSTVAEKEELASNFSDLFQRIYEAKQAYVQLAKAAASLEAVEGANLPLVKFVAADPATGTPDEWVETGDFVFTDDETETAYNVAYEWYDAYEGGTFSTEEALEAATLSDPRVANIIPERDADGSFLIATPKHLVAFRAISSFGDNTVTGKLTADIDMAGIGMQPMNSDDNRFKGTFDGQGHTLANVYINSSVARTGLFNSIEGANVKNLKLTGEYHSDQKYIGGITGYTYGDSRIENCDVAVKIYSTVEGDGTHGGLIGVNETAGTVVENCLVNCAMYGEQTHSCGGVVGWATSTLTINNTLVISSDYQISTSSCNTISRNPDNCTTNNVFYVTQLGDAKGTKATAEQLASGEITYKLNGSQSENVAWFQTIGQDATPRLFEGATVYYYGGQYINDVPNPQLNAFAYNLEAKVKGSNVVVSYNLNAEAESAKILFSNGYVVDVPAQNLRPGAHSVSVPASNLGNNPTALDYRISVVGKGSLDALKVGESYNVWGPYGLAVNNNPKSKNFGQILMAESWVQPYVNGNKVYHTGDKVGALYAFTPDFQPVNAADGAPGFYGGLDIATEKPLEIINGNTFDLKDLRFTEDGRLFVARASGLSNSSVWEINPDDLDEPWKPVFTGGELDEATGITYVGSDEQNRMAVSLAFEGKGNDLKMYVLGGQRSNGEANTTDYNCAYYNLGTATEWSGAPSGYVAALDGVYTYTSSYAGIQTDGRGGLWFIQDQHSAEHPAIKHFDAEGNEDYSDISTSTHGCRIAFTPDGNYLAIPMGTSKIVLYETNYVPMGNGMIFLDPKYNISTTETSITSLAFDYAGNLYVASGGTETISRYTIPTDNKTVVTPGNGIINGVEGDLNKDGKVDIADAVTVLNIMAQGEFIADADLNGDGKIDIADFVTVLNIMAAQ